MDQEIIDAVRRKAIGYTTEERVEEQVLKDGEMQTVKLKLTVKEVAPDISAVKCLIELDGDTPVLDMTEQQLEQEKARLLKMLKESEDEINKNKQQAAL